MARRSPHAGRSLLDIFWEELDEIMDRLMEEGEPDIWVDEDGDIRADGEITQPGLEIHKEWAETRGQAQGVAYCIAIMTNPYEPDIDAIRAEAMERWEKRNDE